jgi:hypothetical protein
MFASLIPTKRCVTTQTKLASAALQVWVALFLGMHDTRLCSLPRRNVRLDTKIGILYGGRGGEQTNFA